MIATEGWKAAMDAQIEVADWLNTQQGRQYLAAYARDKRERYNQDTSLIERIGVFGSFVTIQAEPIWVEAEIVDLVQTASETWQLESLLPSDVLCQSGFVLLERPLRALDGSRKRMAFRAMSWHPVASEEGRAGIMAYFWSHLDDQDDYFTPDDPTAEQMKLVQGHHRFILAHASPWWFDIDGETGYDYNETIPHALQVFFRLAQQRILTHERMRPDRPYRRRAKRYGNDDPYVTVIQLRKPTTRYEGEVEDEHTVEWRNRWLVSGHWRNQWYPSLSAHRQIWISPYVKGPEDRPLAVRELRAWEFSR